VSFKKVAEYDKVKIAVMMLQTSCDRQTESTAQSRTRKSCTHIVCMRIVHMDV